MDDVRDLFLKASKNYEEAVHQIREDQWHMPTPCTEWDVRALMQHLVNEQLWVPPLLEGKTIEQVGDAFDGDNLGNDPVGAWRRVRALSPHIGAWTVLRDRRVTIWRARLDNGAFVPEVVQPEPARRRRAAAQPRGKAHSPLERAPAAAPSRARPGCSVAPHPCSR